jgi:hypothetical protein
MVHHELFEELLKGFVVGKLAHQHQHLGREERRRQFAFGVVGVVSNGQQTGPKLQPDL